MDTDVLMQDSRDDGNSEPSRVLGEYMLRVDRGEAVDREAFVRAHPEAAEELRAYFADEKAVVGLIDTCDPTGTESLVGLTPVTVGHRFGDYELVREIACGGMGVVYEARQQSLQRTVAIKLILGGQLASPAEIERFHREAEMAANLRHSNIVAVHEVGEHSGHHYFAMDYIAGHSLAGAVRETPLSGKKAAQYLVKVADAMRYAHQHGVLHRDLKPSNILIDADDEPHVTDFGLAKRVEGDSQLTATGTVLGSPSYMSPEQAAGRQDQIGPATDIYGLGATLYELLTGRPPFRAESPVATMLQVLNIEPAPPRLLNASVDRDVETICLKCLDKEPARRYDSADALIDDLRHYLADEPIHARPAGGLERLRRWCRRNPLVASSAGATVLFLVLGLAAASIGYVQATRAQKRAEQNLEHACQVVHEFFTSVSEDRLLNEPGMQPLRKELLRLAQEYSRQFLEENKASRADPALAAELALAHYRLAGITEELGDTKESIDNALAEYEKARLLQMTLLEDAPQDIGLLEAYGRTLNALGSCFHKLGSLDKAAEFYEQALQARAAAAASASKPEEAAQMLANTHMNLGLLAKDRWLVCGLSPRHKSWLEQARKHIDEAQQIRMALPPPVRSTPTVQHDIASGHYNLALLALADNRMPAAEGSLKAAASMFLELERKHPKDLDFRFDRAVCDRVGVDIQCLKSPTQATPNRYDDILARVKRLAEESPEVPKYRVELAEIYARIGQTAKERDALDASKKSFEQARSILAELVSATGTNAGYRRSLVKVLQEIAALQFTEDAPRALLVTLRELQSQLRQLKLLVPEDPVLVEQLKGTEEAIAEVQGRAKRLLQSP